MVDLLVRSLHAVRQPRHDVIGLVREDLSTRFSHGVTSPAIGVITGGL